MSSEARRAARPHLIRAALAGIAFLAALLVSSNFDDVNLLRGAFTSEEAVALAMAVTLLVAGAMCVRASASAARKAATERLGVSRGGTLALAIQVAGYFVVVTTVLGRLGANLSGLLLGGALTGIVVGIAAQQTLGNFIAGIVLLVVKPFTIGDRVVMRSGPLGGEYEGIVTEMSLFYVHLETERGPVQLPNAGVLASAIGPGARAAKDAGQEEEARPEHQDPGATHGGTPT